ncbi:MAG: ATP-binding cassette domain-containing protein, partial [Oscillospiraceae bacterium]|nr:ATP-binding cassette domain-containing protein [Oscillospiraceae bacterium]
MIDISVQKIVKSFEVGENILDGVTFDINSGEHVGLLGKNGAGKTTLFRIICGEIDSDEGQVVLAPGKLVGLISQIPVFPSHFTAEDVLRDAYRQAIRTRARLDELELRLAQDSSEEILNEYDRLLNDYNRLGGYDMEYEINRVANGLEIPANQRSQLFDTLSGGEKTRINLARLILEKTDILLLDEPTNHLDINAVEWLEDYLSKFKGTVLIISHDRQFLDKCVNRIVELNRGKADFYSGNYSFFVEEKQRRFELQLKQYEQEQAEAKRLQDAADRLHQWGTGNQLLVKKAFAIESRIERLVKTERPDKEKTLRARFGEADFDADEVLLMKGVSKSF